MKNVIYKKICLNCKHSFESYREDAKYCCKKCFNTSKEIRLLRTEYVTIFCVNCGKRMSVEPSYAGKKYCSMKCWYESKECKDHDERFRQRRLGTHLKESTKQKIREFNKIPWNVNAIDALRKYSETQIGKPRPEKVRKLISMKNKISMNKPKTKELQRKRIKEAFSKPESILKRKKSSKEVQNRPYILARKSQVMQKQWDDTLGRDKLLKGIAKGLSVHPNRPETVLLNLLQRDYSNMWKYSGNVGGKLPDFVNEKEKLIIEMNGCYVHGCSSCFPDGGMFGIKDDPVKRIEHFKKFDYRTLIIWEHELEDLEKVTEKIKSFIEYRKGDEINGTR